MKEKESWPITVSNKLALSCSRKQQNCSNKNDYKKIIIWDYPKSIALIYTNNSNRNRKVNPAKSTHSAKKLPVQKKFAVIFSCKTVERSYSDSPGEVEVAELNFTSVFFIFDSASVGITV